MKLFYFVFMLFFVQVTVAKEAYDVLYVKGEYELIKQQSAPLSTAQDYFWNANMACKEGDLQNAIHTLTKGLKVYENDKALQSILIECLYTGGMYKRVMPMLEQRLDDPVCFIRYIKILEFKMEYKQAIHLLVSRLNSDPKNNELLKHLGDSYAELDQTKSAIKVFEKLIQANPNNQVVSYKLAHLYMKRKDYSSAFNVCNQVLKNDSLNAKFIKLKGAASFNMEEFWTSFVCYDYLYNKGDSSQFILKHLGISELHNKAYENSIMHLETAYKLDTADFEVCFALAMAHLKETQEQQSLKYFKKVELLLQPNPLLMAALYDKMISVYGMMAKTDKEIESYQMSYNYVPKPEYLYRIGSLYHYQLKKPKMALRYYEKFLNEVAKVEVDESVTKEGVNVSLEEVAKRSVVRLKEQIFMEASHE